MDPSGLDAFSVQGMGEDSVPGNQGAVARSADNHALAISAIAVSPPERPAKKMNPLIDLIETEKQYVDLLASIIRRVAAAWSKDNFPPKELDTMFRSIEVIYKANRALLARLNDIGPNPSSPKALGDLLMRWIDDLEDPYERYCSSYLTGFDNWPVVQQNEKLVQKLEEVSRMLPHAPTPGGASDNASSWSLDSLFLLPRTRLKYYRRLYSRLLKSTQPGRSDHRLLVVAVEKLDKLLNTVSLRLHITVDEPEEPKSPPLTDGISNSPSVQDRPELHNHVASPNPLRALSPWSGQDILVTIPTMNRADGALESGLKADRWGAPALMEHDVGTLAKMSEPAASASVRNETTQLQLSTPAPDGSHSSLSPPLSSDEGFGRPIRSVSPPSQVSVDRQSASSSTVGGSQSEDRSSRDTGSTSLGSLGSLPSPSELERKLSVDRVLDIFTMKPKACSLQLNPPDLPFTRFTRTSMDVAISCTVAATGLEMRTEQGHICLLSDLLLVCERGQDSDDHSSRSMRLLYPPLAGRFIRLSKPSGDSTAITAQLLRKVTLVFDTYSRPSSEKLRQDLEDCIAFASNLPQNRPSKTQPSAVAPSNSIALTRSSSAPLGHNQDYLPKDNDLDRIANHPPSGTFTAAVSAGHNSLPPAPAVIALEAQSRLATSGGLLNEAPRQYPPRDVSLNVVRAPKIPADGRRLEVTNSSMLPPNQNALAQPSRQASDQFRTVDTSHVHRDEPRRPVFPFIGDPKSQGFRSQPDQPLSNQVHNNSPGYPLSSDAARVYGDPAAFPSPTTSIFVPPSSRSTVLSSRSPSLASSHPSVRPAMEDISPPSSPGEETRQLTAVISAQMKCKVFLKQAHSQWKSLGGGKLRLYHQQPTNVKQLVVEADTKEKPLLISTIVLTDAVERVGKTGVAIELSDRGATTGVVYMIQLRNEVSATGLFNSLLAGSDRTTSG